jgi:hypothetical protein
LLTPLIVGSAVIVAVSIKFDHKAAFTTQEIHNE